MREGFCEPPARSRPSGRGISRVALPWYPLVPHDGPQDLSLGAHCLSQAIAQSVFAPTANKSSVHTLVVREHDHVLVFKGIAEDFQRHSNGQEFQFKNGCKSQTVQRLESCQSPLLAGLKRSLPLFWITSKP